MTDVAVIMAGGTGERFWPLGRKGKPKQLLRISGSGRSLMHESIERSLSVFSPENIYVVTSGSLQEQIKDDLKEFPAVKVVAEPAKRNTAPCIAFAAAYILQTRGLKAEGTTMSVLTADHLISPADAFASDARACIAKAAEGENICTLGIKPSFPSTGFGYIDAKGEAVDGFFESGGFREKPDISTAEQYLKSGNYYWNSGMFFWRTDTLLSQMAKHYQGSSDSILKMRGCLENGDQKGLEEAFLSLEPTSIDYALMEKAEGVVIRPASFEWKDAGSLDILGELGGTDSAGNSYDGESIFIDSTDNIIRMTEGKTVALIGVSGMLVIETEDVLLICPKERAQEVKKLLPLAEEKGLGRLL